MREEIISFNLSLKEDWKNGSLPKLWKKRYPKLFDDNDLRIALSQPQYHFPEWLAAIHLFKKGFDVLVEQYIYKPHARKIKIVEKIIGKENLSFLRNEKIKNRDQPPDLFVYNNKGFFFVEVKQPRDKLRENQIKFFKGIEKRLKTEVIILRLV